MEHFTAKMAKAASKDALQNIKFQAILEEQYDAIRKAADEGLRWCFLPYDVRDHDRWMEGVGRGIWNELKEDGYNVSRIRRYDGSKEYAIRVSW